MMNLSLIPREKVVVTWMHMVREKENLFSFHSLKLLLLPLGASDPDVVRRVIGLVK